MKNDFLIPIKRIHLLILNIRGERVILDADLATLYGVNWLPCQVVEEIGRARQIQHPQSAIRHSRSAIRQGSRASLAESLQLSVSAWRDSTNNTRQ